MDRERLCELLGQFQHARIAVLGDLFLDRWWQVEPELDEPSVETGLAAHQVIRKRQCAGAAGTVLNNLSTLGLGKLYAIGTLGHDGEGWEVLRALSERNVDTSNVIQSDDIYTPTYTKPMFLQADGNEIEQERFDIKNRAATPAHLENALIERLHAVAGQVDAVIALDQLTDENTGVLTDAVRAALKKLGADNPKLILYADSRAFLDKYENVIIKCNDKEALDMALGVKADTFEPARVFEAMALLQQKTHRKVFVTCNMHGVACEANGHGQLVPAVRQKGPLDICGAGDACTAGIVSALCVGASDQEAAFVGNLSAGVTVRKLGITGTASQQEVLALYDEQHGEP